jgi:hypothetical protein
MSLKFMPILILILITAGCTNFPVHYQNSANNNTVENSTEIENVTVKEEPAMNHTIVNSTPEILVVPVKEISRQGLGRDAMKYVTPENVSGIIGGSDYVIWNYLNMNFRWVSDQENFNTSEYWQFPSEFIKRQSGDCEDWTLAFISMVITYDNSSRCFATDIRIDEGRDVSGHEGGFCIFGDEFRIYDQYLHTAYTTDESGSYIVDRWCEAMKYMADLPTDSKCRIVRIFSNKEYYTFESNDDFSEWLKANR